MGDVYSEGDTVSIVVHEYQFVISEIVSGDQD